MKGKKMICIYLTLKKAFNKIEYPKKLSKNLFSTCNVQVALNKIPSSAEMCLLTIDFDSDINKEDLINLIHQAKSKNSRCKILFLTSKTIFDSLNLIINPALIDGYLNINYDTQTDSLFQEYLSCFSEQKNNLLADILTMEYINDLIYDQMERANQIQSILDIMHMKISPQIIMTILCDDFWQICEKLDNRKRYNIKRSILNITRKAIDQEIKAISTTLIGTDKIVVILDCENEKKDLAEAYAVKCANYIRSSILEKTGYSVSIGLSRYCPNKNYLWKAYEESFQALKQVFFYGKNSVLLYSAEHNLFLQKHPKNNEMILHRKIITNIFSGDNILIDNVINEIISALKVEENKEMEVKSRIVIIIAKITQYFENIKLDSSFILERQAKLIVSIFQATSLKDVQDLVRKYVLDISKIINVAKSNNSKISMNMALSFIKEYYYEDLKLKEISDMVGYSTSYFSRTFSDAFGSTFIKTVVNMRINNAKLFLRDSNLTINDISEKVGFKNSSYFSAAFKKEIGLSPTQYRNCLEE